MKPVSQKDDIVVSLEIYLGSFHIKIFFSVTLGICATNDL